MSAEHTIPTDTPPTLPQEKTLSRRTFIRNAVTIGTGAVLTYSFYESGKIIREIENTSERIESNNYWSNRTPGADPAETDRLEIKQQNLQGSFKKTVGASIISGALFIADLRNRNKK